MLMEWREVDVDRDVCTVWPTLHNRDEALIKNQMLTGQH